MTRITLEVILREYSNQRDMLDRTLPLGEIEGIRSYTENLGFEGDAAIEYAKRYAVVHVKELLEDTEGEPSDRDIVDLVMAGVLRAVTVGVVLGRNFVP